MNDLHNAIANKLAVAAERPAAAFEPNPSLEESGRRLDALREHDPRQYEHPGLDRIKEQVATYRRRKAASEENR